MLFRIPLYAYTLKYRSQLAHVALEYIDMTPFLRKLLGLNWLLLIVMLALAVFGVVAIYSATYMREDPVAADFWRKQANWVVVGLCAFMLARLVNYPWFRWGALPLYRA